MRRRRVLINVGLGVAVLAVGATAVAVGTARTAPLPTGTTVTVSRGDVAATVTATGNVDGASQVDVAMSGSGGTVTKIYVKEGQAVAKGAALLKVSDTAAQQQLRTAEASLASAKAGLATTVQGRSTQDRNLDSAGVASAQTSLDNARRALSQARQTYDLDRKQQNASVSAARRSVSNAEDRLAADRAALASAQPTDTARLQTAVQTDETALASAKSGVTQAEQARDKTLLVDHQAIQSQHGQVDSAVDALNAQRAQQAANEQPARTGAVESAQAQVASAQVGVDQAEQAVADTTLRAPVAGTVANVAAVVGQSSAASGASSSASGGSGAGTGGATGSAGSSGSSAGAGASSGLVTLVDTNAKQVVASVAEADVTKVRAGQAVSVSFPASGLGSTGTVTEVATQSSVVDNVVEYDVTVRLASTSSAIRLGQTADVTITTATHADVLYVATSAITTSDGHATVTRRANGTDSLVEVRTGLVGSNGTEIVAGLAEGDQVVLPTGDGSGLTFPGASGSATPSTR